MKLIIDIDEEKYSQIINSYQGSNVRPKDYEIAIINGTPLPKGHGKLKDADKIVDEIDSAYPNLDRQDIKQWVFNADTIIEADKAESEE